jgi:integrase/recombinase XerD
MARPARRPIAVAPSTVDDLREEFLASCRAKNLSERTVEWYEEKSRRFAEWCSQDGAPDVANLTASHLDAFLIEIKDRGYAPQTVRGFAQVVKTLCRFGYRRGFIADDLAVDLEMPKAPQRIISTFTDDQLAALVAAPDMRRWIGVRDRAILLTMLDTLARASELATLTASSVDLAQRVIKVLGKGGRERQLPLGAITSRALHRYRASVEDLRSDDPFFISCRGKPLDRQYLRAIVAGYGEKAGITGVRCSPHTLRHTGAKRFILAGGDVFTLQRLLGHTSLAMVRRYVELAAVDVALQHARFSPVDSLLRRPSPRRSG